MYRPRKKPTVVIAAVPCNKRMNGDLRYCTRRSTGNWLQPPSRRMHSKFNGRNEVVNCALLLRCARPPARPPPSYGIAVVGLLNCSLPHHPIAAPREENYGRSFVRLFVHHDYASRRRPLHCIFRIASLQRGALISSLAVHPPSSSWCLSDVARGGIVSVMDQIPYM